jgi:hypothetical protein
MLDDHVTAVCPESRAENSFALQAATSPTLSHSSSSSSIATLRSPPTPPDEQVLPPPALTDKPTATLDDGHRPSTPKAAASRTHAHFLSLTVDEDGQPRARPAPWKRAYSEADAPWRAAHLAKVAELLREAQRANGVLQGDEGEAWRHSWMEDEAGGVD